MWIGQGSPASSVQSLELRTLPPPDTRRQTLDPRPISYTPKHLAEKILQSKSALEGERKQVTVLFADVKGSMELAEQLDPEEWHQIMDRFFAILTDGVHRFEGTVNQYTGDGIMALFGAPIAHEDHAQRACYAALHLRDELRRYANELRRERGVGFSARMGLNSGEVVVGKIGDDLRMDYTAQGHTVGLAPRMEQLAEPDACYLTRATAQLVAGYFALDDLGRVRSKACASRCASTRSRRGRAAHALRRRARPRPVALRRPRRRAARARGGAWRGAAGHGRSSASSPSRARARVACASSSSSAAGRAGLTVNGPQRSPTARHIPFLPMLELFRSYFGIADADPDRVAREKIAGRLLLLDESFRELLPLVFEFFGVPDPQRPPAAHGSRGASSASSSRSCARWCAHGNVESQPSC